MSVAIKSRGRPPKKSYTEGEESEHNLVEDEAEYDENAVIAEEVSDKSEDENEEAEQEDLDGEGPVTSVKKPGRGRPPKLKNTVATGKPRGRPKGPSKKESQDEINGDSDHSEAEENSPVNRKGRGRPKGPSKKSEEEINEDSDHSEAEENSPVNRKGRGRPPASAKKSNRSGGRSSVQYMDESSGSEIDAGEKSDDEGDLHYRPYGDKKVKKKKVTKESDAESDGDLEDSSVPKKGRGRPPGLAKKKSDGRGRPPGSAKKSDGRGRPSGSAKKSDGRGRPSGSAKKSNSGRGRPPGGGTSKKETSSPIRYLYDLDDSTSGSEECDAGEKSDDEGDKHYRPYGDRRVKKRKVTKESDSGSDGGGVWRPYKSLPGEKKYVRNETKNKKKKAKLNEDGTAERGRGRPRKESKFQYINNLGGEGEATSISTIPKKRGRPKKNEEISESEEKQDDGEGEEVNGEDGVSEEVEATHEEEDGTQEED